jgi:hypothetical protein
VKQFIIGYCSIELSSLLKLLQSATNPLLLDLKSLNFKVREREVERWQEKAEVKVGLKGKQ